MSLRLPPEAERELVTAAKARQGDARGQLVKACLPLIASVARTYVRVPGIGRHELMQEGVAGLLRAMDRFDPAFETPFWAYASWWVRQAMQQLVSELARPVSLSDRALRHLARIRDARRDVLAAEGRDASTAELSSATALPRDQVESLIAVERTPQALDEPVGNEGDARTLADLLADPSAEDEYERADRRLDMRRVSRTRCKLGEREQVVLCAHYGVGRPAETLREIGTGLGLSAERVRQVEEGALDKLRAALTDLPQAAAGG